MPNWCECSLRIYGNEKEIKKFKKGAKKGKQAVSLEKLYPEPDYTKVKVKSTFPDLNKKFGNNKKYVDQKDAWWDWRIQNWGTKWDLCDVVIVDDLGSEITFEFDTAWSPPVDAFKTISKKYPKLVFVLNYYEPGMGFEGFAKIVNGDVNDHCVQL